MKTSDSNELRDKLVGLGKTSMRKNYYSELLKEKQLLEERIKERTNELEIANANLEESYVELKKTQDYLIQSEKLAALGALVAGISHEVNTPLGICMTSTTFLISQLEELRQLASERQLSAKKLDELTDSALEAARIMVNNMTRSVDLLNNFKLIAVDQSHYEYRAFNLHEYMERILKNLQPELKKRQVELQFDCDEQFEVKGYPGILNQVMTNLIMNSLIHGFVPERTLNLNITCRADDDNEGNRSIVIIYSDDGKGMSIETAQKAFNPFFTTARGAGGSGLGLYIIHNLVVARLKGNITLDTRPDKGTTFTIRLHENQHIIEDTYQQITW